MASTVLLGLLALALPWQALGRSAGAGGDACRRRPGDDVLLSVRQTLSRGAGGYASRGETLAMQLQGETPTTLRLGATPATQLLAYSFTTDPDAPYFTRNQKVIFDFGGEEGVDMVALDAADADTIVSEGMEDTVKQVSGKVGIEGSYYAFSGAASVSAESMSQQQVKTVRIDKMIQATKYRVTSKWIYPHRMLTKSAKEFLLNEEPAAIMRNFGVFFATQLTMGGVLQTTYLIEATAEDSKSSLSAQLEASYGTPLARVKASAEGTVKTEALNSESNMRSKWSVKGGDASLWLQLQGDNADTVQKKWADSITDENLAVIKYSLRPVWELLDHAEMNPAKAKELQSFMLKEWKTVFDGIPDFPFKQSDHPLHAKVFKLQNMWPGEDSWISFTPKLKFLQSSGSESEAMPLEFEKVEDRPNTYLLRNVWPEEYKWVSFTDEHKWLRAIYHRRDAMPVMMEKVEDLGDNVYIMKNAWWGFDKWISFTEDKDGKWLRANYTKKSSAMPVRLVPQV